MKTTKKELDVDFIGDQKGLTKTEEKALSDFFRQRNLAGKSKVIPSDRKYQPKPKANPLRS